MDHRCISEDSDTLSDSSNCQENTLQTEREQKINTPEKEKNQSEQ